MLALRFEGVGLMYLGSWFKCLLRIPGLFSGVSSWFRRMGFKVRGYGDVEFVRRCSGQGHFVKGSLDRSLKLWVLGFHGFGLQRLGVLESRVYRCRVWGI